jgi:hypothetical protein
LMCVPRHRTQSSNATILHETAKRISKGMPKESKEWLGVYALSYDALHLFAESLCLLEKCASKSHLCLFAALCVKRSDLELSFEFFEKVRTVRNGMHYYGKAITFLDWKEVEAQMEVVSSTLRKAILGSLLKK